MEAQAYDAFDVVLRAFEESWNLGHEFRLIDSHDRAIKWLAGKGDSWSARIGTLIKFALTRGHSGPTLGKDYGVLSELAHPTRSAANNSVTISAVRIGIEGAAEELGPAQTRCEDRITYGLYRLIWLMLDADAKFIPAYALAENMRTGTKFIDTYPKVDPAT